MQVSYGGLKLEAGYDIVFGTPVPDHWWVIHLGTNRTVISITGSWQQAEKTTTPSWPRCGTGQPSMIGMKTRWGASPADTCLRSKYLEAVTTTRKTGKSVERLAALQQSSALGCAQWEAARTIRPLPIECGPLCWGRKRSSS